MPQCGTYKKVVQSGRIALHIRGRAAHFVVSAKHLGIYKIFRVRYTPAIIRGRPDHLLIFGRVRRKIKIAHKNSVRGYVLVRRFAHPVHAAQVSVNGGTFPPGRMMNLQQIQAHIT